MNSIVRRASMLALLLAVLGPAPLLRAQDAAPATPTAAPANPTAAPANPAAASASDFQGTDALIREFVTQLLADGPQKPTAPDERFKWAEKAVERIATGLFKQGLFPELRSMICQLYEVRPGPAAPPGAPAPKKDCASPEIAATLHYLRASSLLSELEFTGSAGDMLDTPVQIYKERERQLSAAKDAIEKALDALFEQRRQVDADRYRGLRARLLVQRARYEMYWADLGYRLLGPAMVTALFGDSQAPEVSARYGAARQYLFEGIILDPKNVEAKLLGEEIESRLRWLKENRAFGGLRFFEVEPVMGAQDGAPWTPLARLQRISERLIALQNDKRRVGEARQSFSKTLDAFRDEIQQAQKQRQARLDALSAAIAEVRYKVGLQKEAGREFLSAQTERIQSNLAKSESTRRELQLRGATVEQEVRETLGKLEAVVSELGRITPREELERSGLGAAAVSVKETFKRIDTLLEEFKKTASAPNAVQVQTLAAAWSELQQSAGTAVGRLQLEKKRLESVAEKARQLQAAVMADLDKLKFDQLEAVGQSEAEAIRNEMRELQAQGKRIVDGATAETLAFERNIQKLVENSIRQAQENVKREIENVRSKIDKAKQLIETFKQNKQRFEQVVSSANAAIQAAGAMQSGVIAGTANGVFTNVPQALMKVQELGVKLVEFQRLAMNDIRQAEDTINELGRTVERYRSELASLGTEEKKAEINSAIKAVQERVAKETGHLHARLVASVQQLKTNAEAARGRITDRFRTQTQALLARKAEHEAEAAAIVAEISGNSEKIETEKRRARELARRIAVLEQELGTRKGELDGISKAIEDATVRSAAIRDRISHDTLEHQALLDDVQGELAARLRFLQEQANQLVAGGPEAAGLLPLPNLAAATIGLPADAIAREEIALIDEANRLTFQFANWLYLLSREPRALEWAISAQTPWELSIVMDRLNRINQEVQATVGLTTPRFFGIRLSRDDIATALGNNAEPRVVFSVSPGLNGFAQSKPLTIKAGDEAHVGDEAYSMYAPLPAFRAKVAGEDPVERRWDKSAAELIFAPFVETEVGALSLIWDVWVVPRWRTAPPPELGIVGLHPVGPTEYLVSGSIDSQPVLRPREPNFSSTTFSYDRIRAQHRAAIGRMVAGKSVIDGTLPGMNYRSALGRGLGNTWELVLPRTWSTSANAAPAASDLEGVDIIFGYLVAPERGRQVATTRGGAIGRLSENEIALAQKNPWFDEQCANAYDRLLCAIESHRRSAEREGRFKASVADTAWTDPTSLPYAFHNSPAGRAGRVRILDLWHDALPKTAELGKDDFATVDETKIARRFLGCFAAAPDGQGPPAGAECPRDHLLRMAADVFPDRKPADGTLVSRIREMTHRVVREEMLALPNEPAPVGPIELLRIWRSLETLIGNVHAAPAQSGDKPRPTLLAEIEAINVRLEQLDELLGMVEKDIGGPIAVVRRLVDDYETSRMQLQFAKELADALRSGALLRQSDLAGQDKLSTAAKRLIDVVRGARMHECPERWLAAADANPATKAVAVEAKERLRRQQYRTLQRAYEVDFDYLLADAAAAERPLELDSFPMPSCAGPLTDVLRLNGER